MALGSAAISMGEPSEQLQARFQHLSAGLLIGAVVCDIFPILRSQLFIVSDDSPAGQKEILWLNVFAAAAGFGIALLVMYSIKAMELDSGEDDESKISDSATETEALSATPLLRANGQSDQCILEAPGTDEEQGLSTALAKLAARADRLSQLVATEDIDRESVDKEVHRIDFLVDSARRRCRGIEPFDPRSAARLQYHCSELGQDILKLQTQDSADLQAIDKQLRVIVGTLRHLHSHAHRGHFRRWG
ncbi:unnamed protein product, partial [Polarella glacialis]